jgi:transcriptional regulator with XRE-family HTH domain
MKYQRLRDLREDHDLHQKDIAKILQTTQQQYGRYERGVREIPARNLAVLADFYHTSVDYLMGRTNNPEPYPSRKGKN